MANPTILIAFIAGFLSFVSPCILPIIPGFISYLSTTAQGEKNLSRYSTFLNSLFFVLGFSTVFALLGVLLNATLSASSYAIREWLGRFGGAIIILFALHVLGLIRIPFLMYDHKIEVKKFRITYITSFVFGVAFAIGWSPCVGAILGSVLALAISNPAISFALLMAYALGLGIPFLIAGLFAGQIISIIKKSGKFLRYFNIVVGILLLILGVLVFTNNLILVANILPVGIVN